MGLTRAENTELTRLESQLARHQSVLDLTSGLGASSSDLGQSANFTPSQISYAERMVSALQIRIDQLKAKDAGEVALNPYRAKGVLHG